MKQTWWDDNLPTMMNVFLSWVGGSDEISKVFLRKYIINQKYKSIIDLGCGPATEYFAYKEEYPIQYLGIDSSKILYDLNISKGIPMVLASAEETKLMDNHSEVVFSRHVLEHQESFELILKEMIRLASKEAIHIFFIKPTTESTHIGYDATQNLYHNRYNKQDIEEFLSKQSKVFSYNWEDISSLESALFIKTNI